MGRLALSIAAPLGLMALAYLGGWELGRVLAPGVATIAQLSGAALWSAAPIVAGIMWAAMPIMAERVAAVAFGVAVSIGWVLRLSVSSAEWSYGALQTPTDWLPPVLLLAVTNGVGMAVSGRLVASLSRSNHPWWAGVVGAACAWAVPLVALLIAAMLSVGLADR